MFALCFLTFNHSTEGKMPMLVGMAMMMINQLPVEKQGSSLMSVSAMITLI
jgi:hypothetical protein